MNAVDIQAARAHLLAFIGTRTVPSSTVWKWAKSRGKTYGQAMGDVTFLIDAGELERVPLDPTGNASKSSKVAQYAYRKPSERAS